MPPLFDRADDEPSEGMPQHLIGKSAEEVNAYWAKREKELRQELGGGGTPPTSDPPPPTPPRQSVTMPQAGMTPGQAATLIAGAKMLASQGKEHWQRFLPEVEAIMGQMTPEQQMDANMWNTVYDKVVGVHVQDLVKEAREAALRPPSMESSAPPTPPAQSRQLTAAELHVVDQLRRAGATALRKDANGNMQQVPFDSEAYLAADERRKSGSWPLTFNNY